MREIEINLILTGDAVAFETNLKYLARCDVARNEVAVGRILFLEKIPTLALGNVTRAARVAVRFWNPNTTAFTTSRFAHQPQLVLAGNRCRMDLYELAIRIPRALLITG